MMEIDQLPTDLQAHPNPHPNPHHRKVELQSPLDLTYLQENIAAAAKQKLDLNFPPDAATRPTSGEEGDGKDQVPNRAEGKEDAMRVRVATLVNQFLSTTFNYASHSISINGNDVYTAPPPHNPSSAFPRPTTTSNTNTTHPTTPPSSSSAISNTQPPPSHPGAEREGVHFAYEPYDPRLSTKLASLYAELERETLAVSQLRRTAPAEGARMVGEALLGSIKEDEERNHAEGLGDDGQAAEPGLKLDPLPEGWSEETAEMYERGLADLTRLAGGLAGAGARDTSLRGPDGGSLTETVGKVQRARDVTREFE
ncbi:hypothetical protein GJ744_012348 [Endocarpon pusillum]|uniref:Uncharacterized protein n=1 Tax=Endocarpon pusillum TaxID=364733 RepID=A0A8H7AF68_9EURO|nr:hypothetical protein GJ744_012348 [Endocarpon pusillum]